MSLSDNDSFAAVYKRHPEVPPRGLVPGRRVWLTLAGLAAGAAMIAVVPMVVGTTRPAAAVAGAYPTWTRVGVASSAAPTPGTSASPPSLPATASPPPAPVVPVGPTAARPQPSAPPTATRTGQPAPIPGRAIVGVQSMRCLSGTVGTDGTQLVIATCDGSATQHWQEYPDGTIRSAGLCMDAAWGGTADLTVVQLAYCSGNPAQHFRLNASNDLVNVQADKCVDVTGQQTASGSAVTLYTCNGQDNQKWFWR
jgi:Ricin-type beta-trefoil lectin domain